MPVRKGEICCRKILAATLLQEENQGVHSGGLSAVVSADENRFLLRDFDATRSQLPEVLNFNKSNVHSGFPCDLLERQLVLLSNGGHE